jgi:hypothetical protein
MQTCQWRICTHMTTDEKVAELNSINADLLNTLINAYGFKDASFIYTWKWSLSALLIVWREEIQKLNTMDNHN